MLKFGLGSDTGEKGLIFSDTLSDLAQSFQGHGWMILDATCARSHLLMHFVGENYPQYKVCLISSLVMELDTMIKLILIILLFNIFPSEPESSSYLSYLSPSQLLVIGFPVYFMFQIFLKHFSRDAIT